MGSWTTEAKVTRYLPTNHATYLTTSVANLIIEASEIAEGDLSPRYWPFPDATDTPATPAIVQNMVAYLAGHLARLELGRANELELTDEASANNLLALYRGRVMALMATEEAERIQVPTMVIDCEAMTFGVNDSVGDNEYLLDPGGLDLEGFEVIVESARIDEYEYGVDFVVAFSPTYRAWVVTRYNGAIVDGDCITYAITFVRSREIVEPNRTSNLELIRG